MKDDKTDTKNPSRQPPKETKTPDFSDRLASLSDSELRKLKKLIDDAVKSRDGKGSLIGKMSNDEFSKLRDDLIDKKAKN